MSQKAYASLHIGPEPAYSQAVRMDGICLTYCTSQREVTALQRIDLGITAGRFVAIVGPSGCGKSTLLHLMSGLVQPTEGQVEFFGEPLRGLATGTGYVFQADGLLAWKTVTDNMALPLRLQRRPQAEINDLVNDWLRRTGLSRFANAYPSQLSGGMRKRVALAQALISQPKLVLMDEPLSALDVQTRTHIGNELLALWARAGNTVVLVTHDLEEAIGMADEVVVLTARPSRVKTIYQVDIPRPRDLHDIRLRADYQELYKAIWADLREEVLRSHVQSE